MRANLEHALQSGFKDISKQTQFSNWQFWKENAATSRSWELKNQRRWIHDRLPWQLSLLSIEKTSFELRQKEHSSKAANFQWQMPHSGALWKELGGLQKCSHPWEYLHYQRPWEAIQKIIHWKTVLHWQDHRGKFFLEFYLHYSFETHWYWNSK